MFGVVMNISVSLTPELIELIKAKVASGRYSSTSEVVREALRLLERTDQREAERMDWLREAWNAGVGSGDASVLDFAELRVGAAAGTPRFARNLAIPGRAR
jgi:antitoxin ParD1/3/4